MLELGVVGADDVVGVDEVVGAVEVGLEVVVEGLLVEELELELDVGAAAAEPDEQSRAASCSTVVTPWPRFCRRVVFTVEGRWLIASLSEVTALAAAPQSWELTAEETAPSWALRLEAWSPESRPLEPPQATANAAANPRPPARNAR